MVPVSLRTDNDADGGNMVGPCCATLPPTSTIRPSAFKSSMHQCVSNKQVLSQLPRAQALALSMLMVAPAALVTVPGFKSSTPPTFNVVISNVPGMRQPLYLNGARQDGNYPLSIPLDGQALNFTLANNADNLDFGLVGCRRTVPHLQRLLGHLETSLKDLERAVGI